MWKTALQRVSPGLTISLSHHSNKTAPGLLFEPGFPTPPATTPQGMALFCHCCPLFTPCTSLSAQSSCSFSSFRQTRGCISPASRAQVPWQVLILEFGDRHQQPSLSSGLPICNKPVWRHFWWAAVDKWSVFGHLRSQMFPSSKAHLGWMGQEIIKGPSSRAKEPGRTSVSVFQPHRWFLMGTSLTPLPPCFPTGAEPCEG